MAVWLAIRVTGHSSNWLPLLTALLVGVITYPLLDLPFFVQPGQASPWNISVSVTEGVLAAALVWGLSLALPNTNPVGVTAILLTGLGVALGEWFVHRALVGPKPVAERDNRPPNVGDD